jgi:hypothetical protein
VPRKWWLAMLATWLGGGCPPSLACIFRLPFFKYCHVGAGFLTLATLHTFPTTPSYRTRSLIPPITILNYQKRKKNTPFAFLWFLHPFAMGRLLRDVVASIALFSVVATEGKSVGERNHELLIRQTPVSTGLQNGWTYSGCYP